jgi:hypothetical protein
MGMEADNRGDPDRWRRVREGPRPEKHHAELERRLSEAYHETGHEAAKASLEATARWLE